MRFLSFLLISLLSLSVYAQNKMSIDSNRMNIDSNHKGIRRIVNYNVSSPDVPCDFEGVRIAFLTDIHYRSRLDERGLTSISNVLNELKPDVVLLGGDYQEGCDYVLPMVEACTSWRAPLGMAGVMGNNDYERCTSQIIDTFESHGVRILENDTMSIYKGNSRIIIAGAKNSFTKRESVSSPTLSLSDSDFVILLSHTPDYIEDQNVQNTDIALSGHTHGGQVTLFGLLAPVNPSHYGRRFLRGVCRNSNGIPMIVSTGIGTSRKNIRMFAPSEIVVITLHHND